MTNAGIKQNLSAILPGNWSVMQCIYLRKKVRGTHPDKYTAREGRYLVHMPVACFQAPSVRAAGELLSETTTATRAVTR